MAKNKIRNLLVISFLIFFLSPEAIFAQADGVRVRYRQVVNGQPSRGSGHMVVEAQADFARAYIDRTGQQLIPQVPVEQDYVDYTLKKT